MLKKLLIFAFLFLAAPALAQNVQQGGSVTRNHIPVWLNSGVIGDGGSSADSPITSIGITNNGAQGLCINSARQSSAGYNALCLGASTTGPATISLQNFGSATPQGIQFIINGTSQGFPTVQIPVTVNDLACFASTGGTLKDCGPSTNFFSPTSTFSDFIHDDGAAINTALTTASNAGGGWVLLNPSKPYWASTQITIPNNVTLGCIAPPQKFHSGSYTNDGCAVYLAPNNTIINNGGSIINARVYQDNIHFAGVPTTQHGLKTITLNYVNTGTGIKNNAADSIIQDVAIVGFNLCIDDNSAYHGQLRHIIGECANGLKYETIADTMWFEQLEFWPFYSAAFTQSPIRAAITNVADNGSGAWRVTYTTPAEAFVTGDEVYIGGTGAIGIPFGALGKHSITAIDSTHFDLTGSQDAPSVSVTTTNGSAYVTGLASTANLWPGMTFTGACFTGTRTLKAIQPGALSFVADANATSSGSCTLSFVLQSFAAGGTPFATFDPLGGQHGIGVEFNGSFLVVGHGIFVWSHDVAFQFDTNASGHLLDGIFLDDYASEFRSDRIGIWFKSGAGLNKITGNSQTSGGIFLLDQSNLANNLSLGNFVTPGRVQAWVWGAVENDSGPLTLSGLFDPDSFNPSNLGSFNSDVFNAPNWFLSFTNGSALPNANFWSAAGNFVGLFLDGTSFLGNRAVTAFTGTLSFRGVLPVCAVTGAGTGASCALTGNSNSNTGQVLITTGTTPAASGTIALTGMQAFTGTDGAVNCAPFYMNVNAAWSTSAITPQINSFTTTSVTWTWNNNGTNLTNPGTYRISYVCFGN